MFLPNLSQGSDKDTSGTSEATTPQPIPQRTKRKAEARARNDIKESECFLTSIKDMRAQVRAQKHTGAYFVLLNTRALFILFQRRTLGDCRKAYFCGNRRSRSLSFTHTTFDEIVPSQSWCPCVSVSFLASLLTIPRMTRILFLEKRCSINWASVNLGTSGD